MLCGKHNVVRILKCRRMNMTKINTGKLCILMKGLNYAMGISHTDKLDYVSTSRQVLFCGCV